MMYNTATPYIASYMILRRGNTVAFLLRSNTSWMDGHYSLPSGKVEKNETFSNAAIREVKEEAGIDVEPQDIKPVLTVQRKGTDSEWVDVYFEVKKWSGEPFNAEPNVHGELAWLDLDNLPDNVIPSVVSALEQVKLGNHYFEDGWDA